MHNRSRILGVCFGVIGVAALLIAALMNRRFGMSLGVTEDGKMMLGNANIVIDVALALFGSGAGYMWSRRGIAIKVLGIGVMLVAIGCAAISIYSIMGFIGSEQLSITRAEKERARAKQERLALAERREKERMEMQSKLAESQLRAVQKQLFRADGSRERKDLLKGASEAIAMIGAGEKADAALLPPDDTSDHTAASSTELAKSISDLSGMSVQAVQITQMAAIAVMLIIIETLAFPLMTYFFAQRGPVVTIIEAPRPLGKASGSGSLALPPPDGSDVTEATIVDPQLPSFPARPEPPREWRSLLRRMGMPDGAQSGPLRPSDEHEHSGVRFLAWLAAYDLGGDYRPEQVDTLYEEFCAADYKRPLPMRIVKSRLSDLKRYAFTSMPRPKADGETRRTLWTIKVPTLARAEEMLTRAGALEVSEAVEEPKRNRVIALFSRNSEANAS